MKNITEGLETSIDDVSATVSGGLFPVIQKAVLKNGNTCAPSGGTWWCIGYENDSYTNHSVAGGGSITKTVNYQRIMCIKIA